MKKQMRTAAVVLSFFVLIALSAPSAMAKEYVMLVPMVEGLAEGSFAKVLKEFTTAVSKKTGIPLSMKDMPYSKGAKIGLKVLEQIKSGKADFAQMNGLDYAMNKKAVDQLMVPVFTMNIMKHNYTEACAYVKSDSPYKTIADLKGKTWGGTDTMHSRYLMVLEGIDKPVSDFFGKMVYIADADTTKPLDALLGGKIDAYITSGFVVDMVRNANTKYSKSIRSIKCQEYEHNWIFFANKNVPSDVLKTLQKTILTAHKDKDFAQFQFMLKAIQGNFIAYDASKMSTTEKIYKIALDRGWLKEEDAWLKKNQK